LNTRHRFYPSFVLSVLVVVCLLVGCRSESPSVSPPSAAPNTAPPKTAAPSPETSHKTTKATTKSLSPSAAPRALHPIANPALATYQPTTHLFDRGAKTAPAKVALTFDACYSKAGTHLILQALAEHHLHCTFFLAGFYSNHYPESAREIADAGMEIGNHSYSHPHFTKLTDAQVLEQLDRSEDSITSACGRGARPLFRFPYGDSDRRTLQLVVASGYQPIHWTLDSLDSVGKPKSAEFITKRIESKIKPGSITLMHVSYLESAKALPHILDYLEKNGYQVVPVSELLLDQQEKDRKKTTRQD
jgi:peptidoglycan/xylan/chitin deacetylase (PgdA/CDA1 family)